VPLKIATLPKIFEG